MPAAPLHLCLAPLRGVTGRAFRQTFVRHFSGLDRAVTPFLSTLQGSRIRPAHLAEILPAHNAGLPLVPQVIGKSPDELHTLLAAIRGLGYACADLNAGCPWPFVVKKGRGAGLLRDAAVLRRMLEAGCAAMPDGFSIKVRLGIDTPDLLASRLDLLNEFPLREVTIHARTARQMYAGTVDLRAFGDCLARCRHPVVYNGDIRTPQDLARLSVAFPSVAGWMIGRGLVADPFLAERIRGATGPRDLARLKAFLDDYLAASQQELFGPAALLGRLKELWSYLHVSLAGGDRLWKTIRVSRRVEEYRPAVDAWFERAPAWVDAADGIVVNEPTAGRCAPATRGNPS